jgi:hypothetical protein
MRRQHNWTAGEKLALTVECESHKTVSLKTRGFLLCAPFSFAPTNGSTPLGIPLNWLLVNGRPRVLCGEREGAQLSLLPCASIFFRLVRIVLRPSHSVTSENDAGWVLRSLARWFNYGACQNISMSADSRAGRTRGFLVIVFTISPLFHAFCVTADVSPTLFLCLTLFVYTIFG